MSSVVGFYAGARHKMDLEEWTVAGRGFGLIFVWLLMAGEIYTTFTFLGASGWAYSRGAPALYVLAYMPLAYVVSFFLLPLIWEVGRKHGLQTQADYFQHRYGSKALSAFVALVGVVFIIPYLQLQLVGLGIIVEIASFGGIHRTPAMIVAFAIVAAFVFASGVRGVAWVSVIKDISVALLGSIYRHCGAIYIFRRNRKNVCRPYAREADPSGDAGSHKESRSFLVCFDGCADLAWFLHVAAKLCIELYRKEQRHAPPQCGGNAALWRHHAVDDIRRFLRANNSA